MATCIFKLHLQLYDFEQCEQAHFLSCVGSIVFQTLELVVLNCGLQLVLIELKYEHYHFGTAHEYLKFKL